MYLTYDKYIELGGELEEAPFTLLEYKSRKQIDKYSYGRLVNGIPENLKQDIEKAMMVLMEFNASNKTSNIVSETIDGYSVSYGDTEENENKIKTLISDLLEGLEIDGVPLTYCGGVNDYKRIYYPIS